MREKPKLMTQARAQSSLMTLRLTLIILISLDSSKLNLKLIKIIQTTCQKSRNDKSNALEDLNLGHLPMTMKTRSMPTLLTTSTPKPCVRSNWKSFSFSMSIKEDRKIQIYTKFVSKLNQFLGKCIQAWTLSFNTDLTTQSVHVNYAISSQGPRIKVVGSSNSLGVDSP